MNRDCDEMTLFAINVPRMFVAVSDGKCVEPRTLRPPCLVLPMIWLGRFITILSVR